MKNSIDAPNNISSILIAPYLCLSLSPRSPPSLIRKFSNFCRLFHSICLCQPTHSPSFPSPSTSIPILLPFFPSFPLLHPFPFLSHSPPLPTCPVSHFTSPPSQTVLKPTSNLPQTYLEPISNLPLSSSSVTSAPLLIANWVSLGLDLTRLMLTSPPALVASFLPLSVHLICILLNFAFRKGDRHSS